MASLLGVSAPAVSQWKRSGAVPVRRLYELKDKRPDLFKPTPASVGWEIETVDAAHEGSNSADAVSAELLEVRVEQSGSSLGS